MDKPDWWTSDHWATPPEVFDAIARRFGPFDLDACATETNAKCPHWYSTTTNGLLQPWTGIVWVNPPYSDPEPWIRKAIVSVHSDETRRVVMLLPAAIDTTWFHDLVMPFADVLFVRGRIRFLGWEGTPIGSPKAGNVLAIFPKVGNVFVLTPPPVPTAIQTVLPLHEG